MLKFVQDFSCPSHFYGCGQFAASSFRIFCRGDHSGSNVVDPTLRSYLNWLRRPEQDERTPKASKGDPTEAPRRQRAKPKAAAAGKAKADVKAAVRQTRSSSCKRRKEA